MLGPNRQAGGNLEKAKPNAFIGRKHGMIVLVAMQCSFFEHREYKIVYRRYASLFFITGVDENEVRCLQQLDSPDLIDCWRRVLLGFMPFRQCACLL